MLNTSNLINSCCLFWRWILSSSGNDDRTDGVCQWSQILCRKNPNIDFLALISNIVNECRLDCDRLRQIQGFNAWERFCFYNQRVCIDHLSPVNGTILRLRLIDVSTDKNIYIDKLLVEEKRAKHIERLGSSFLACYTSRQTEISVFFMYC